MLQTMDRELKALPRGEERVRQDAAARETATDPAPLGMAETTIVLKPQDRVAQGHDAGSA